MEIICATAASAALVVPGEPDMRSAAALVRRALAERGLSPWPRTELELFPGEGGSLILARPAPDVSVAVADYALPFLLR